MVYVRGLDSRATKEDLEALAKPYGTITDAKLLTDPTTKECRGFGFVTMSTDQEAQDAITGLEGLTYKGQRLQAQLVLLANKRPNEKTLDLPHQGATWAPELYNNNRIDRIGAGLAILMIDLVRTSVHQIEPMIEALTEVMTGATTGCMNGRTNVPPTRDHILTLLLLPVPIA